MKLFQQNARFVVPLPFLFLAVTKAWEATHGGNKAQLLASCGFFGVALLSYLGQKHIYQERQKKTAD
jgi:hypothetical protein